MFLDHTDAPVRKTCHLAIAMSSFQAYRMEGRQDRPEYFLRANGHGMGHARKQRRFDIAPLPAIAAPSPQPVPWRPRICPQRCISGWFRLACRGDGAHSVCGSNGSPTRNLPHLSAKKKLVQTCQRPSGSTIRRLEESAALHCIEAYAECRAIRRIFQIGSGEHDDGVFPTQFQARAS